MRYNFVSNYAVEIFHRSYVQRYNFLFLQIERDSYFGAEKYAILIENIGTKLNQKNMTLKKNIKSKDRSKTGGGF